MSERDRGAPDGRAPDGTDPSRLEAVEAGVHHEAAEADAGVPPRDHVAADDLPPDALAQRANDGVLRPEPASRRALLVVSVVAVAVLLAVIAVAVAVAAA